MYYILSRHSRRCRNKALLFSYPPFYEVEKKTELGIKAEKYMKRGLFIPNELIVGVVKQRLVRLPLAGSALLSMF